MRGLGWVILLGLTGCTELRLHFEDSVDAAGARTVFTDQQRGDLRYSGAATTVFDVQGVSWARGGGRSGAERRTEGNDFEVVRSADTLELWSRSDSRRAGVDFDVLGPQRIDIDAVTLEGTIDIDNVEGVHTLTGSRVFGTRVIGDVDAYADWRGMDIEIYPYLDGNVTLQSDGGDLTLLLPYGADYDIEVFADPNYTNTVTDLGFDSLYIQPDYVGASRGRGEIRVSVVVTGGAFTLLEAL